MARWHGAGGYTLVELVVTMMIFSVVLTLIAGSFNRIVSSSSQIARSAETDIGGLIGLELMRTDLELAGFGLPWSLPAGFSYTEADSEDPEQKVLVKGCPDGCPGAALSNFRDAPDHPPRAILSGDGVGINGSDYLVLKGTALGMSRASRSWSYLNYSSNGTLVKPSRSEMELVPGGGDRVIVLKTGVFEGGAIRELVTEGGTSFSLRFNTPLPAAFSPSSKAERFLVYGVAPAESSAPLEPLEFPFNRSDYFISRTDNPSATCARVDSRHGTGTLYKAVVNHHRAKPTYYPILDCVADLQVVYSVASNGGAEVDLHPTDLAEVGESAAEIREKLKEVRVYILAQQGRKDAGYQYPVSDPDRVIFVGDPTLEPSRGSVWSQARLASQIGPQWRNYHWKVYSIVVKPRNL